MSLALAPDPVRAGIYIRISRDPHDKRNGVTRQYEDCVEVADDLQWQVVEVFDENNVSATKGQDKRLEYLRYLTWVKANRIDAVVFWEFDRYTRDVREADDLLDMARDFGLRAASTSGGEMDLLSPNGRHNVIMAGSSARRETDMIKKRLRRTFDQMAATGRPHGAVPYGWKRVKEFDDGGSVISSRDVLDAEQAAVIREATKAILAGTSVRAVVKSLNDRGSTSPRARKDGSSAPWESTTLKQVLLRARNAGLRRHRGRILEGVVGDWPTILTREEYDRLLALLTDPQRRTNKGATRRHLLTGIARCGRDGCDGTMVVNVGRVYANGKHQPPAYVCKMCTRVRRKQTAVDERVEAWVVALLEHPEVLDALSAGDPAVTAAATTEIEAVTAKMSIAADQFADDIITADQLNRITAKLKLRLEAAEATKDAAIPAALPRGIAGPDAGKRWALLDLDGKRALIEALVDVVILPVGPGRDFDPASVSIRPALRPNG